MERKNKMFKKVISFVFCLVPVVASAKVVTPEAGSGGIIRTDQPSWDADGAITIDGVYDVDGNPSDYAKVLFAVDGLNMDYVYVGASDEAAGNNTLSVLNKPGVVNSFNIKSDGDIEIADILQVYNGYGLSIGSYSGGLFDLKVGTGVLSGGIFVGYGDTSGDLTITGVDELTVDGRVSVNGTFAVGNSVQAGANTVNISGTVDVEAGSFVVSAVDAVSVGGINFKGINATDVANIIAGSFESTGDVVNSGQGNFVLNSAGNMTIVGDLINKGATFSVLGGGDLIVNGRMENASNALTLPTGGKMTLNLKNWQVKGGVFDNSDSFVATVQGETVLSQGFNFSGMDSGEVFSLTTGKLTFGNGVVQDLKNFLGTEGRVTPAFELNVTDGDLVLGTINNGALADNSTAEFATMRVTASGELTASSVVNAGEALYVSGGSLEIDNAVVVSGSDSQTQLVAQSGVAQSGVLKVGGQVTNAGELGFSGLDIDLASVVNTGNLGVVGNGASNSVKMGSVTNSGNLNVVANAVSVGDLVNNAGTVSLTALDEPMPLNIGSVYVTGGEVSFDVTSGSVEMDAGINVEENGTLIFADDVHSVVAGSSVIVANNIQLGTVDSQNAGNINVASSNFTLDVTGSGAVLNVGGVVSEDNLARVITLDSNEIVVSGDSGVDVSENTKLVFGDEDVRNNHGSVLTINSELNVSGSAVVDIYSDKTSVGTLNIGDDAALIVRGTSLVVNSDNGINVGDVLFGNSSVAGGISVQNTNDFTLSTDSNVAALHVNNLSLFADDTLNLLSKANVAVDGTVLNRGTLNIKSGVENSVGNLFGGVASVKGDVTNYGNISVVAQGINMANIANNAGTIDLTANGADIVLGQVTNTGNIKLMADKVEVAGLKSTGNTVVVSANDLNVMGTLDVGSGTAGAAKVNLTVDNVSAQGDIIVRGDVMHGTDLSGMLNLIGKQNISAKSLTINGMLSAMSDATYDVDGLVSLYGMVNINNGISLDFENSGIWTAYNTINNMGNLKVLAQNGISIEALKVNGDTVLNSGNSDITIGALQMGDGTLDVSGKKLVVQSGGIDTDGMLYQGYAYEIGGGDINISSDNYVVDVAGISVADIVQDGKLVFNTSDITVSGDIVATDLRFNANPTGYWMNVEVGGDISGNVDFVGVEKITVGGDYTFNQNSVLSVAALPYAAGSMLNTTDINYWSKVSLENDGTLGKITNAIDGRAMIDVGGSFISGLKYSEDGLDISKSKLLDGQIGIDLFDVVDQGTAIWLLYAKDGIQNFSQLEQLRNLEVRFCNADGSICFDYIDAKHATNATNEDLPIHLSVRDLNSDGIGDSLYVVFDPRFGGPVVISDDLIQKIVARVDDVNSLEIVSAGALDNLLLGQSINKGFYNRTPIEATPLIFADTNMSGLANELYNRIEYYEQTQNANGLVNFSRLVRPYEAQQIAGTIALNEHTAFRSFEDRMFDEFIWNRNRNLKKAWLDVDYGMLYQDIDNGSHSDGNRFSLSGGFDWQQSNTLVLGLTGRVSHTTSHAHDSIDLGYIPGTAVAGHVAVDVADTNVGFGAYLMKILGTKARVYGNAFADIHFLDTNRNQNFVNEIDGDGTAFSLISEWGLMHDILNQYIVGNAYARLGYNFGFDLTEKADNSDYMKYESDGYFVVTPGYSLIAQKRIYPSAWFQIRPYASIGIEYDVLGTPDNVNYKFAPAKTFTEYEVDIDPLWANIGAGLEMLSANGLQVGIDYRYQYNADIQLHNIKVSGSYRF